jgi:hypothetical protein
MSYLKCIVNDSMPTLDWSQLLPPFFIVVVLCLPQRLGWYKN